MGVSFSVSGGHFSHREHDARFTKRVNDSRTSPAASRCGMCRQPVAFDAPAYRCSQPGCTFLLHDGCYRRPETAKGHLGRPRHRLTLAAAARTQARCSLCAEPLRAPAFVYGCGDCGGFRAHPRCYELPPDMSAQHEHGKLALRAPSGGDTIDGGGAGDARRPGHRRRCLGCKKKTTARTAACSYQCRTPACDAELCLRCVLSDGTPRRRRRFFTLGVLYFGQVVGTFIKGILTGMGFPANWWFRSPI